MERLWQRYKDQGLIVIALSMDASGATAVKPFIEEAKYTYRVGLDPKMEIAQLYGARSLPATFIIDRNGALRAIALGPREWDGRPPCSFRRLVKGWQNPVAESLEVLVAFSAGLFSFLSPWSCRSSPPTCPSSRACPWTVSPGR
jgi:alkyl hydroperoxide reductase subunit AhpC